LSFIPMLLLLGEADEGLECGLGECWPSMHKTPVSIPRTEGERDEEHIN
jgi:hypothetical protein